MALEVGLGTSATVVAARASASFPQHPQSSGDSKVNVRLGLTRGV